MASVARQFSRGVGLTHERGRVAMVAGHAALMDTHAGNGPSALGSANG